MRYQSLIYLCAFPCRILFFDRYPEVTQRVLMAECVVRPTLGWVQHPQNMKNHCLVTDQTVSDVDATGKK